VTSEVEERIHKALQAHRLERLDNGYRLVHPAAAGVSTLRLLPADRVGDGQQVAAIAEITADYGTAGLPSFHATGVQRLNAMAIHGAYTLRDGALRQTAQYSIYANETAVHLAVQSILNAFGAQLPLGRSTALATKSPAVLKQQRAHHALPHQWQKPLAEESLKKTTGLLQRSGLAASNNAVAVWAELPLSGNCPSRSIDPQAQTALLQVNTSIPHPIAGAGYFSTLSLPLEQAPPNTVEICRRLNELELEQQDFVPRLGAWGLHGPKDLPGYSCLLPSAEPLGEFHTTIMWWCARRAAWLRDRFWSAQTGLQLEALGA